MNLLMELYFEVIQDIVMNIETKYHNVYYYGILSNIIEYQQEEFLTKLWEFSHTYLEEIPE